MNDEYLGVWIDDEYISDMAESKLELDRGELILWMNIYPYCLYVFVFYFCKSNLF